MVPTIGHAQPLRTFDVPLLVCPHSMSFDSFGLDPQILKAIAEEGYTEATPIQAQAIPVVLQGGDVMGAAQTGTGKTAGFTLPILQLLQPTQNVSPSPARHPVRALILLPTRELALQVAESVATYGRHMRSEEHTSELFSSGLARERRLTTVPSLCGPSTSHF